MVHPRVSIKKSLNSFNKMKKQRAQSHAVCEIKKCRRSTQRYVSRLPYKHLLKEFASELKSLSSEDDVNNNNEPLFTMLHNASQAHLSGIFEGFDFVCQSVKNKVRFVFFSSYITFNFIFKNQDSKSHFLFRREPTSC